MGKSAPTREAKRLEEARKENVQWRKWGPYLSERQWGTVREDYSKDGNAWDYFSHDQARSRAYRWGEDGIAGVSDDHQVLCFALALWNGKDPILKERMFGCTNSEGNHGEDVKEYYYYLDSTPTHSYMKYLYKYPQAAYPYDDLVATNRSRGRSELEYELMDTGIFGEDRYFDVFVEYAKASPTDLLIRITACNRGPDAADIHLLPTLWYRNTWSWAGGGTKPVLSKKVSGGRLVISAAHTDPLFQQKLEDYYLYCDGDPSPLFTENETNNRRLFGTANASPYVKDGINNHVVAGEKGMVNPAQTGTKACAHYRLNVAGGQSATVQLRLTSAPPDTLASPFGDFDQVMAERLAEADDFYASLTPPALGEDQARVMRQALSGMLWSKQYFYFDVNRWLDEHDIDPFSGDAGPFRNREWFHMVNDDIISMPDKWEYPWYAAWDLAFHTMALSVVDTDFAKSQLDLMTSAEYLHPSGQIPAYEWNFSDVNPPVHGWACLFITQMEKLETGKADLDFLRRAFNKLTMNFTWWVNRKDRFGKNLFEGGFLGLDNIGVFDRSAPLPTGGHLEQADGTAWMALFCQNMAEIACELATYDPVYEDMTIKFLEHFLFIANSVNRMAGGQVGLWDEEDGFYYDVLRKPDGCAERLKVRSMVGLLPLCAVTVIEKYQRDQFPRASEYLQRRLAQMPELREAVHVTGPGHFGVQERGIAGLVNEERLRRILTRMLDENEFLSPYGIRALSRYHLEHPYVTEVRRERFEVRYLPAESDSGMFGGNSNWRGPIWMPVNALIIRALLQYYLFYGDNFLIECPTGSGRMMNLFQVAHELSDRLASIFLRDQNGRRPVFGGSEKFQADPHWRDHILFYEYFHGDNGAGLGASHQTGWTGLVARLIKIFGRLEEKMFLEAGKKLFEQMGKPRE
ncbi:MAG TPA: glucosidase [Geomonas sp.]|nr:glucosidase [Geomonas sp.]